MMADNEYPDSSTQFSLLYLPKDDVGEEVELLQRDIPEKTGRKRKCNPEAWTVKHVKKTWIKEEITTGSFTADIQL